MLSLDDIEEKIKHFVGVEVISNDGMILHVQHASNLINTCYEVSKYLLNFKYKETQNGEIVIINDITYIGIDNSTLHNYYISMDTTDTEALYGLLRTRGLF